MIEVFSPNTASFTLLQASPDTLRKIDVTIGGA